MELASTVAVTFALLKSSPKLSTEALKLLNSPFTLVIIRCFTLNNNSLCVGSIAQVVFVAVVFMILFCLVCLIITLQRSAIQERNSFTYVNKEGCGDILNGQTALEYGPTL